MFEVLGGPTALAPAAVGAGRRVGARSRSSCCARCRHAPTRNRNHARGARRSPLAPQSAQNWFSGRLTRSSMIFLLRGPSSCSGRRRAYPGGGRGVSGAAPQSGRAAARSPLAATHQLRHFGRVGSARSGDEATGAAGSGEGYSTAHPRRCGAAGRPECGAAKAVPGRHTAATARERNGAHVLRCRTPSGQRSYPDCDHTHLASHPFQFSPRPSPVDLLRPRVHHRLQPTHSVRLRTCATGSQACVRPRAVATTQIH
jgi:hypothetical protein